MDSSHTIVHSTEATVSEFFQRVEVISGLFEFCVAEDLNSKVGASLSHLRSRGRIRRNAFAEMSCWSGKKSCT